MDAYAIVFVSYRVFPMFAFLTQGLTKFIMRLRPLRKGNEREKKLFQESISRGALAGRCFNEHKKNALDNGNTVVYICEIAKGLTVPPIYIGFVAIQWYPPVNDQDSFRCYIVWLEIDQKHRGN